jgi:hypothetical protein
MEKTIDFKEHAHECRRLAATTSNHEHRAALFKMAETWESLATERSHRLLRQEPGRP